MKEYKLTRTKLSRYETHLIEEEKSEGTIEKYLRDIRKFILYADGRLVTKELVVAYKLQLKSVYKLSSANSMLTALNCFFDFLGWKDCQVRLYKKQKEVFIPEEKELTKEEYFHLVRTANELGKKRLACILQTIGATGIRVSELAFITVEALRSGKAYVDCKGKQRSIFIPKDLRNVLKLYAKQQRITSGPVFITRSGKVMNRSNIWSEMKKLCAAANIKPEKVYPHNIRHLFAREFYAVEKDIAKLADILGHSSIETTRIYIISTGKEHERQLEKLRMVV